MKASVKILKVLVGRFVQKSANQIKIIRTVLAGVLILVLDVLMVIQ